MSLFGTAASSTASFSGRVKKEVRKENQNEEKTYTEFSIPKKNGKPRKICSPSKSLLAYQQKGLKALYNYYFAYEIISEVENIAHGFLPYRNCVTAATYHIGFETTIMMDISNFFDSVTRDMIPMQCRDDLYFHKDRYCAQGFATSPILANIAAIDLVKNIKHKLVKMFEKYAFTMYADDIQISFNSTDKVKIAEVVLMVKEICIKHKFSINESKTRVKFAKYGFRRILGINVGDTEIRATRQTMRKIRAAEHSSNYHSLGGLINWSRCHLPVGKEVKAKREDNRREKVALRKDARNITESAFEDIRRNLINVSSIPSDTFGAPPIQL